MLTLWFGWVHAWGYFGIFLLMVLESSIVPVPSEMVIPPAAYWASQGQLNLALVILVGSLGSLVGATIMYFASRYLGRPLLMRYGKYVLITRDKIERAEIYLARYETGGVFFARLLPVIRHLIGIPAGVVEMPFVPYAVMTLLGSAAWCSVLAAFGHSVLGSEPQLMDPHHPEALLHALSHKSHIVALAVLVLAGLYFVAVRMTRRDTAVSAAPRQVSP